ncbi:acetolactate synthase AlsS [Mycobacterium sp. WMMD1722]|uniref:acetolactate synthase AlsS n=1 Tax=Mycobacterium sp. WMMD1722 TaxID=3404117 RepID=UPI003BF58C03
MTPPSVRSAQRVVDALDAFGVRYVFGVPGAKIDAVYDCLLDGGPQLVVCRHEQNAAFMAAAVGRLTGTPGAVLVTSGPGTSNLPTGLLTANTEQYPLIAICGAVDRADRLKRTHQSMDAAQALRPFTKYVAEVDDPDNVGEAVANALRVAVSIPQGATAVILPQDVARAETRTPMSRVAAPGRLGPAPADAIASAVERIRQAKFPVILAGMRAADTAASDAIRGLLDVTELPVVETFQAAGTVSRALESHYLGRVGLFRNQPGDVVVSHADLVIAIGYDPVEYDPRLWNIPRLRNTEPQHRNIVHVDSTLPDWDNHYQPVEELRGDIAATVAAMSASLTGLRLPPSAAAIVDEQRTALQRLDHVPDVDETPATAVDPVAVVLALREALDDDATLASDIGTHYIYLARHFRTYEPGHLLFSDGQQTLGVALPWAMAASMLRPGTQIVSISGDGGFLFSAQELETARRLGLKFTHVIMRDNSYDMVKFEAILKYGRANGVELGDYDIASYAAAFGASGVRVSTLAEFRTALRDALDRDGITLIDVAVDYSRTGVLSAELHDDAFE